jgi:hypothetical protein
VAGAAVLGALALTARLSADNGDIRSVSRVLEGTDLVDLTADTSDGTFWALGSNGSSTPEHRVYHLSRQLTEVLGFIDNPHPMGSIAANNLTLNRGIAFETLSGRLFVLASVGPRASQTFEVRVVSRSGVEDPAARFTVAPEDADGNLFGLTYDLINRQFWTLDVENARALRVRLDGTVAHSFPVPPMASGEYLLRGQGISYDPNDLSLYVTLGNVFSNAATKVVQFQATGDATGTPTGIEVPLADLDGAVTHGIQNYRIGLLRRVAVLGAMGLVYEVEQVVSMVTPPSRLSCTLTRSNQVALTWRNHGRTPPTSAYQGPIQILRNGVPFVTVSGDSESFTDATPVDGVSTYALRGSDSADGPFSPPSCPCTITVGPGGLIDMAEIPGANGYGVAEHATTGEVFVTDNVQGRIYRFDPDLNLLDADFPSPWTNPGAIAYLDRITLGFPPQPLEDFLMVAEAAGNRARIFDVDTPTQVTTIVLRFPADIPSPRIGDLTYITSATPSEQRFAVVERTTREVLIFNTSGSLVHRCVPPPFLVEPALDYGLTYDPRQSAFLAGFEDGLVREIFAGGTCPPSGFEINLAGLAPDAGSSGYFGGMQVSANTLLVCVQGVGVVTRHLIFPFGPTFVRGDFNDNDTVDMTDAVGTARYLFQRGPAPSCLDAADSNDDGILDVSDPVFTLFFLFVGSSSPPPAPFPDPGDDPTFRDNLGCGA